MVIMKSTRNFGGGHFQLKLLCFACKECKKCYNSDMLYHRRFGFTLAEVLITLGIVGVVAALTLPCFDW